jgi:hypothetical protein
MPQRKSLFAIDFDVYKWRHLIENVFDAQGVQAHRHARLQNRPKLPSH